MKRHRDTELPIGCYSEGTMRPEDLIPDFVYAASNLHLTRGERATLRAIEKRMQGEDYYESEDSGYDLDELFDILGNHCPPYFYFGSHPGDGACYGVWLSECFQEDFDGLKVSDLSEVLTGYTGEVLHVNDHGNMSLYAYSRGKCRELWAIV